MKTSEVHKYIIAKTNPSKNSIVVFTSKSLRESSKFRMDKQVLFEIFRDLMFEQQY